MSNDTVGTPGGSLTIISISPTNGVASIIGGTNVQFIGTNNFIGVATIGYTIIDNVGGTNSSLITVTVTNVPPVANPDSYTVSENTTNVFTPFSNDKDGTPADSFTISLHDALPISASIIGGTNVQFIGTNNFIGVATIGYTIIDNVGGTNSSLITVTVTNVPPVANPDSYTV